ncbi:MAG TPA: hypothetical protein VHV83_13210 [Armatimonadota bacterium]|nr:hypothetical protein [Armatimonadota bacterium]
MPEYLTCPFCAHRFTLDESAVSCSRCSMFGAGGCKKIRCPHCGYEMPPPARLPQLLGKVMKKIRGV